MAKNVTSVFLKTHFCKRQSLIDSINAVDSTSVTAVRSSMVKPKLKQFKEVGEVGNCLRPAMIKLIF